MPSVKRIVCLANSRKHGAFCFAGIDRDSGAWVRPVSALDDGRVERSTMAVEGKVPALGDIVEIPLDATGPDFGFESENRAILPGPWRICGRCDPGDLPEYCGAERFILHNSDTHVTVEYLTSLPQEQRRTLQLIEAFDFEAFSTGPSAQGGRKWNGTCVSPSGERFCARITDPVLVEKLERGYCPGRHCTVTASLSMPYKPENWHGEGTPCWKLIAGVVEMEPGEWLKENETGQTPPAKALPVPASVDENRLVQTLKQVFGFTTFRPNQRAIIDAILGGRDCFAVMPTGGGKSLCFQLPALLMDGACLIISPLIALMKDQVDAACANGIRAAYINSAQTEKERIRVFNGLSTGNIDLLYISPERFSMETFLNTLARVKLCMVAVDEAHCVSEWGHDFRPEYLFLSEIVRRFPAVPVAAFTATATQRVQNDIISRLALRNPLVVRASFNRPNLHYCVQPKTDIERQIAGYISKYAKGSGIVYRTTRDDVDSTAAYLRELGMRALPYHAGLDAETRRCNQEAFDRDEADVVVATIAFGMGIDKPNVRFVLHGDLPKNMEAYYQETGRAGRDGEPAECVLFFSVADIPRIKYFIKQGGNEAEKRRLYASLHEMVNYAQNGIICRRRKILAYFGELLEDGNCAACDICNNRTPEGDPADAGDVIDVTSDASKIIEAIAQTGERYGAVHIVDIVCGANTKRIRQWGHDKLAAYSQGKGRKKEYWRTIAEALIQDGVLRQTTGEYPVITFGSDALRILRGERLFSIRVKTAEPAKPAPVSRAEIPRAFDPADALFECLRSLRRRLAREKNVPSYVIFPDRTLHDMCAKLPCDIDELRMVYGVGEAKLEMYGETFLAEIRSHVPEKQHAYAVEHTNAGTLKAAPTSMETQRATHVRAYEKWLPGDDERLSEEYRGGMLIAGLSELFMRNEGAIRSRLRKLGLLS